MVRQGHIYMFEFYFFNSIYFNYSMNLSSLSSQWAMIHEKDLKLKSIGIQFSLRSIGFPINKDTVFLIYTYFDEDAWKQLWIN